VKKVRRPLLEALASLERALVAVGAPHMIIGGIAVIARGVVRQTDDVDATVWAEGAPLAELIEKLREEGITGRIPDLEAFARDRQVLLLRHEDSRTPMEVTLAWLPFEREALARAEPISLQKVTVPVAQAEDLVIYKAIAWRDRDRADIERLVRLHRGKIDLHRVREIVQQFAEALDEPTRIQDLDRLIERA
jgi:predicted nucleotidyltransferase